jgi:hypothetical protein
MIERLNRQRVLNLLDTYYSGDIEGALDRCTDDIDYFAAAPVDILPHLGHHHGKAGVRQMWQTVHARYSSMRYEAPIVVAEGDKVAVLIRSFFRKRGNDRIMQFNIAAFFTLRDGLVAQIHDVIDSFDLVQQVVERDVVAVLAESKPHPA